MLLWLTLPLHLLATALLFSRHLAHGEMAAPWRGFKAALRGLPMALRARKEAQAARKVGSFGIARGLCWSPRSLVRRLVVLKPAGKA